MPGNITRSSRCIICRRLSAAAPCLFSVGSSGFVGALTQQVNKVAVVQYNSNIFYYKSGLHEFVGILAVHHGT